MDRRTFILCSGSTLATVSTPLMTPLSASAVVKVSITASEFTNPLQGFSETDWTTIATVQNHLFPSETDAPGAVEINALSYLHQFLSNPDTDVHDIEFILSGTRALQKLSIEKQQKSFADLTIEQRESLLRDYEKQRTGKRWLITLLNYILEALLTDPVYGGNPNGVGWKWLQHRAGEPRPPAHKRYWLL